MPTLDPQVINLLDMARQTGRLPFEAMTPEAARIAYTGNRDLMQLPAEEVAMVRDITLPDGLVLRVVRGIGTDASAVLPCLLFLHGGGWVIGDLESHDRLCRRLANVAGICVVAVDYRLAPEHRFPAALDDSLTALQWIAANADTLSIARDRLAVGGDSAGGNLAAVLALMGRDGTAPRTMFQSLIYPVVDLTAASQSYQRVTSGMLLTAATMHYFIDHYTPDPADRTDWRASPLLAASLADTPPALVVTVAHDPLCDEGLAYAKRLEDDGVRVTSLHLNDQIHGMLLMGKLINASNTVVTMVGTAIGAALHHGSASPQPD
ncbi:alpha/beta hydrolase [Actimicrobium sp. CCI2.3]|uniref:alpha/beta hydrolase n=1 Tax=Actimicrobium sp. CCI2.3 TaxID=3048616 RepID=UPI002AB5B045|nr:alpha/beta hydrolase [Actimicrobium sp. CCI2.3]MDY7575335.1 alpha/beta hydrolase [Actimicrobium sp. CCI2.3]MEB0023683.1 alpha/beta hydrolase [Actimicrobium sp. CCI2.3]